MPLCIYERARAWKAKQAQQPASRSKPPWLRLVQPVSTLFTFSFFGHVRFYGRRNEISNENDTNTD
jgi:hypothetical protein